MPLVQNVDAIINIDFPSLIQRTRVDRDNQQFVRFRYVEVDGRSDRRRADVSRTTCLDFAPFTVNGPPRRRAATDGQANDQIARGRIREGMGVLVCAKRSRSVTPAFAYFILERAVAAAAIELRLSLRHRTAPLLYLRPQCSLVLGLVHSGSWTSSTTRAGSVSARSSTCRSTAPA